MKPLKILILLTSHEELGPGGKATGFWLEELAVPYQVLTQAGAQVDLASPKGGRAPADPRSLDSKLPAVLAFQADPAAQAKLAATLPLAKLDQTYDAVFVAGGHGVMWDLAVDQEVGRLLSRTYEKGGVVAAVCHGPAGLVNAKAPDGRPLVAGKRVAGFSNEEERGVGLAEVVPFLLQSKLESLGARYEHGPMWKPFVIRDGRLVTGQNPASSEAVAKELLIALGR